MLDEVRECIAKGLFDTGRFYEKIKKELAAQVYYEQTLKDYPDTKAADLARKRIQRS